MKPHYIRKGGQWWVFKSRETYKLFINKLRKGDYINIEHPRPMILTECGWM